MQVRSRMSGGSNVTSRGRGCSAYKKYQTEIIDCKWRPPSQPKQLIYDFIGHSCDSQRFTRVEDSKRI